MNFAQDKFIENSETCKEEKKNENNIYLKKNIVLNNYTEYKDDKIIRKLGKHTFGLDKVLPWEDGNFVFSGSLLMDAIKDNFNPELTDIDLFFYGSIESKKNTVNNLLNNLEMNQYDYLFGYNGSIMYIFVQGIPRIIQLIMTNKTKPEEIIDGFDFTHIQFYFDGSKIYGSYKAIEHLKTNTTEFTETHKVQYRLIKYLEKGNESLSKLIFMTDAFILNSQTIDKILYEKKQKILYKKTHNLTLYSDFTPINFNEIDRSKLELKDYFDRCKIYYGNPRNKDLSLDINMVGNFIDYFRMEDEYSINSLFNFGGKFRDDKVLFNYNFSEITHAINFRYSLDYYNNSTTKCIYSPHLHSFYLPCEFVSCEDFNFKSEIEDEIVTGKKIYLKLKNKNLEKKITSIINIKTFKNSHISVFVHEEYPHKNRYYLKDTFLNKFDENDPENIQKIFTPFENTLDYPTINLNSTTDKFINTEDLIIKSNIYNVKWFENINGVNFFENLNSGQEIYCTFRYFIHINYNLQNKTINKIDFNLQPCYVCVKK